MLLFNEAGSLTYKEIKHRTGMEDPELTRNLQSLACGKVKVLLKEPKGKDVNVDDQFSVNEGFAHDLTRIKINTVQLKETKEEQKQTETRINEDRDIQLEAAIVRIMKTRKRLHNNALFTEVASQMKFEVNVSDTSWS